jgi:hypothetical protein
MGLEEELQGLSGYGTDRVIVSQNTIEGAILFWCQVEIWVADQEC